MSAERGAAKVITHGADFNLFLKTVVDAEGKRVWSIAALNAIPIGGGAIAVVVVWFWAFVSDYFQTRWLVVMAQAAIGLIPSIIMSVWNVPLGAKYFSCKPASHCS